MKTRDARDAGRPDAPMKAAPDAIHIDTGTLNADEVFERALVCL
jgi:cytidylate kinase